MIAAVGPSVAELRPGARVAIEPSQPCRVCRACTTGHYNLCLHMVYLGSASTTPPTDGVFQEYIALPAACCHPIPDILDDGRAALLEPLSVAPRAIRQAGGVSGATVLVAGGGAIGQPLVKELRLVGSFRCANVFPAALALAASGRVPLDALITHTLPFAQFHEATRLAVARNDIATRRGLALIAN